MFDPSEVEGEVDHSFFDSDAVEGSVTGEGGETTESPPVQENLQAEQNECRGESQEDTNLSKEEMVSNISSLATISDERSSEGEEEKTYLSKRPNKTSMDLLDEVKENLQAEPNQSRGESQEDTNLSKEEIVSNISSLAMISDERSSEDGEDKTYLSKTPDKTSMDLLDEVKENLQAEPNESRGESQEDRNLSKEEIVSYISSLAMISDESSSEGEADKTHLSKRPNKTSMALSDEVNDRHMDNQCPNETEEKSPTSAEEADSESSFSFTCSRCHKPMTVPSFTRKSQDTVGGAGSEDVPTGAEWDDRGTDVNPLPSPHISLLELLDLNQTEAEERQQQSVPPSGRSHKSYRNAPRSFRAESHLKGKLVGDSAGHRNRKNYSFNNNEVRRIDQENHRLLGVLSRLSSAPSSKSAAKKKTDKAANLPATHLNYSAVNRQRYQTRIEVENMAFLKRLQSTGPSRGMSRLEQLSDYHRLASYYK